MLLNACAVRPHEPAPDLVGEGRADPWFVHCETAESHSAEDGGRPGVHHARWIRAVDQAGTLIALSGELDDGFLVVRGVRAGELDGSLATQLEGMAALRKACLRTLREIDGVNQLATIRAFREHEGVGVSLDFNRQNEPGRIRRVIVFGDSLTDSGNLKQRMRVFPGPPYWIGRFSNGPTWVDYLETWSGMAVQNHAYGGASVTGEANVTRDNILALIHDNGQFFVSGSIEHQIEDFHQRFLGGAPLSQPEATAFILWAGANDYISKEPFTGAIDTLLNHPLKDGGYQAIANRIVDTLQRQIAELYDLGARHVLIGNLPDLGSTPIVVQNETYPTVEPNESDARRRLVFASRLSALSRYHNQELARSIVALQESLPDLELQLFDVADGFAAMLRNEPPRMLSPGPGSPEFAPYTRTIKIAAEGLRQDVPMHCYSGGYLGTFDPSDICEQVHRAIFWDNVHPTTYTHCWVSYLAGLHTHQLGWTGGPPAFDVFRQWCQRASDTALGHHDVEPILTAEAP